MAADAVLNLRPQPSGETREAVRLALEDADALDRVSEEADDNQWQDWAATMRQAASRIRRLALLSTSPLALGGQQGDSETLRVLLDNLVIAQTLSKDIRQKATDEARSYLYGRRHTTARAEALDDPVSSLEIMRALTTSRTLCVWADGTYRVMPTLDVPTARNEDGALVGAIPLAEIGKVAMPAPDEDRVRIAANDLLREVDAVAARIGWADHGERERLRRTLAALKSEGK